MPPAEEVAIRQPVEKRGAWYSLLASNQYNQIATSLEKAHKIAVDHDEVEKAALLAAAMQLCASCMQLQQEVLFHEEAHHQSEIRRDQMDAELYKLLEMVEGGSETAVPDLTTAQKNSLALMGAQIPRPKKSHSLWERLIAFFGFRKGSAASQPLKNRVDAGNDVAGTVPDLTPSPDLLPEAENVSVNDVEHFFSAEERSKEKAEKVDERPILEVEEKVDVFGTAVLMEEVMRETAVTPNARRQNKNAPTLVVYCLGPFRVFQDDQLITDWNGMKGQLIFKYLIAYVRKPIAKDTLMDVFWPDADPEASRRNLHQAIYSLRQALRRGHPDFQHIQFENDCYLLNSKMLIWVDCHEFEKHVQAARQLEEDGQIIEAIAEYGVAESLYHNVFLEEDLYEEWTQSWRERLRILYLKITNRLSSYYFQQGEHTAAIALCRKALRQDNCCEEAHLRLMQCYLAQNQRHMAVRQYHTCAQLLKEELDISPSQEIVQLYQHIIHT